MAQPDFLSQPQAFARANAEARLAYLRSLTMERAARDLEELLNLIPEFESASRELGLPPAPPLPPPRSLAPLLGEWPPDDEE